MSTRDLTILGSGSQVPTRHRNHNGYLIRFDGEGLLIDPGEGTQRQFTYAGMTPSTVTRILITHFHGDHCLGLAGMFQRLSLDGITHPLHLYYPASGRHFVDRMRGASIYHDRLEVVHHPIEAGAEGVIDTCDGFSIEGAWVDHPVPTLGYRIVEPDGRRFDKAALDELELDGPLVGELLRTGRIEWRGSTLKYEDVSTHHKGMKLAIVLDTRPCSAAIKLARDVDWLIIESTFEEEQAEKAIEYGHMTAREAAQLAKDAGARQIVLTHFSQRYLDCSKLRAQAEAVFGPVHMAEDLMQLPLR